MNVLCTGEILIDFISEDRGKNLSQSELFRKKAGGSPLNVAVALRRLGRRVSFLGKLGKDQFSSFLLEAMKKEGIDTTHVVVDPSCKTTLAFVARDEMGNPDFVFFRENPADTNLRPEEVKLNPEDFSFLHIGSYSLVVEPSRSTYLKVMEEFLKAGKPVSYDPNVRASLIEDRESFVKDFLEISSKVDIVKLSDKDLEYIFQEDLETSVEKIPIREDAVLFVTMGEKGCLVKYRGKVRMVPAFKVEPVDATGCGDSFTAAVIHKYLEKTPETIEDAVEIGKFANAVAAIVITRVGGVDAMPVLDEVEMFLSNQER
ncbi:MULTISPECIES: carbohydrate kinase family protein [unclassified Thermotoga]|uniref:carbohydrate kinase family protein n=1 Tax=unclassified Thermotoga TaxID=2631113 RepID=UPI000540F2F0|nr:MULTISPECIES: carbohydrate kinase [unclassified Thermotoga]AIY87966.1 Fructokinase [Thermotoga sp. Cell2]KHC91042.1 Fructokinase [Thermotoga sp. TBGT1765]KHC91955.1 Fructokinase [Thermotoga sp. TBGT1766]KHC96751.1 Fructokinase [Thermotoga sp. Xyl54]